MMVPRSYLASRQGSLSESSSTRTRKRRSISSSNRSSPVPSRSPSPARTVVVSSEKTRLLSASPPRQPSVVKATMNPTSEESSSGTTRRSSRSERTIIEPVKVAISQPMVIPTAKPYTYAVSSKTVHSRSSTKPSDSNDANSLPPAVAALLAVTAIPPPRRRTKGKVSTLPRRVSMEHLRKEWNKDTSAASSLGIGSPLDFLLEPADSEDILLLGDEDVEKQSMTMASRSVSSESIISTPSLEADMSTFSSQYSTPSTPLASLRRPSRIPERKVCSPPAEECLDHPLLSIPIPEDSPLVTSPPLPVSCPPTSAPKPRSTFKSNLTASLLALRSAAKAFSNFTAPSLPSDDLLTRSLFSSQRYASEMRPRNFGAVADPALRRYLNPPPPTTTPTISSPDFHSMLTDALGARDPDPTLNVDDPPPMIQMQTYTRNGRRKSNSGGRQEFPGANGVPLQRQREPRENGDFLRVIVLEMNMRRTGKLDAKAAGRARVWLPPRKGESGPQISRKTSRGVVPVRWVGITVDEM